MSDLTDPRYLTSLFVRVQTAQASVANSGRDRDWSWRCADAEGGFNPYGWNQHDQAIFESAWHPEADDLVDGLIGTYGAMWPWIVPTHLLTRLPVIAGAIRELSIQRRIGQGHTYAHLPHAVYEHAAMYGSFNLARARRSWADFLPQTCPVCHEVFNPGQLNPWIIRQFGPARWCKECCMRARNGSHSVASAASACQLLKALADSLGTVPPQNFAEVPVPLGLPPVQRDAIVKSMGACPSAKTIRSLLGAAGWVEALSAAEVISNAWRPARGTYCVAEDGHPCRSLGELTIDNWLTRYGVSHEIEPMWPRHPDFNPHGRRRADWLLADGTYVEYAELIADADYAEKIRTKQQLAHAAAMKVVVITPTDLANLADVLGGWMQVA